MTESLDTLALEAAVKVNFGMAIDVRTIIAQEVDVGRALKASVFLTKKKQLYCHIHGQTRLKLSDVMTIVARMGLKAELYVPPKGQPQYFDEYGRDRFREVFPGRRATTDEDIRYYRTLAPYCPALVQINEVSDGTIYQFDADARGSWRPCAQFAYRRIRTSV